MVGRLDRAQVDPIACSLVSGGALRHEFAQREIPVVELGVKPGLAEMRGAQLWPVLRRYKPAIVHSRLILSNLWARLGSLSGARVICEEQGIANERPGFMTLLNRLTQPLCAVNVANSRAVAARLQARDRIPATRLRVIYGGVDTTAFVPSSTRRARFDIVTTTRLEPYKGVSDLIDAMHLVVRARPDTTLSIVGDGSERRALERRVADRGLAGTVTFWGLQSNVVNRLQEGRVFVLSSHEEGLPNAAMEAMACGLPVVATRVGGTPELVADGVTGVLVPAHEPSRLAAALVDYLGAPDLMRSHGAAGRERCVRFFDLDGSARSYRDLYFEVMRRGV
jgi:glycosyltransferase involved in cell wall biosynthesis